MFSLFAGAIGIWIGFIVSNFLVYFWTLEDVLEVHKWGFAGVLMTGAALIMRHLLDSQRFARELAQELYNAKKVGLDKLENKLKNRKSDLDALYDKHRLAQNRLAQELSENSTLKADLSRKISEFDEVLVEIESLKISTANDQSNSGRSKRETKKLENIILKAETIKKEQHNV